MKNKTIKKYHLKKEAKNIILCIGVLAIETTLYQLHFNNLDIEFIKWVIMGTLILTSALIEQ